MNAVQHTDVMVLGGGSAGIAGGARHSGGGHLCFHHRAFGVRSPGDHRHVEQDFYLLDFYFLQDAASRGVA